MCYMIVGSPYLWNKKSKICKEQTSLNWWRKEKSLFWITIGGSSELTWSLQPKQCGWQTKDESSCWFCSLKHCKVVLCIYPHSPSKPTSYTRSPPCPLYHHLIVYYEHYRYALYPCTRYSFQSISLHQASDLHARKKPLIHATWPHEGLREQKGAVLVILFMYVITL